MIFVPARDLDGKVAGMPGVLARRKQVAERVAGAARGNTPVGATGRARRSVRVEEDGDRVSVTAGGRDAFYYRFIEFGTVSLSAKKPMRRAAEAAGVRFIEKGK